MLARIQSYKKFKRQEEDINEVIVAITAASYLSMTKMIFNKNSSI